MLDRQSTCSPRSYPLLGAMAALTQTTTLALFLASGAVALAATGGTIVVPNANATAAGNDNSSLPPNTPLSIEAQTVVDPDQFPAGTIYITGFALRASPGTGALSLTASSSIYLSTSTTYANSTGHTLISTTFANNVGPDNTLVFSGTNATISAPACAAPGPCPFGSPIAFTTPFPYNPAKGPLLIDQKDTSLELTSGQIDLQDCNLASCAVSGIDMVPLGSPTAAGVSSNGTIMQLIYSTVPAGTSTSVTLNLTQSAQTHTVPYINTFAETGSAGTLGNATLYMTSSLTIDSSAAVVPPIPLTAVLYFDQLDSIIATFNETDVNFASEPTFTLSNATITGGTGTYAGSTGSLSLTFKQSAGNVYTTTGSGSVTVAGKTVPLTLTNFQGSGGSCNACSLEYNKITYTGTASPLGNVTFTSTIDVTNSPPLAKILFGTVSVNATDSFNIFASYPSGSALTTLTVAGGTGAYAGATGSFSITQTQNSAGLILIQGTGTVVTAAAGAPLITSVKTAFGGPVVAYNTWLQINGTNLVPANTPSVGVVWSTAPSFAQNEMPTQLGTISVTINGLPGYIYFYCSAATDPACAAGGDQINVLAPLDTSSSQYPVEVVVTDNGVSGAPFTVLNNGLSPTLPLYDTVGHIVAKHLDFSLLGPTNLFPPATTPAKAGETIVLVAYGLGPPSGTAPTAGSATQSGSLPSTPQCWISGSPATVAAALISPGLYQLNVTVPTGTPSGDNPISCVYQGYPTFPGTLVAVQ